MAAPAVKMVVVSEDSSSSDDEALRRCQEAVWETKIDTNKGGKVSVLVVKRDEGNISAQIVKLRKKYDVSLSEVHP